MPARTPTSFSASRLIHLFSIYIILLSQNHIAQRIPRRDYGHDIFFSFNHKFNDRRAVFPVPGFQQRRFYVLRSGYPDAPGAIAFRKPDEIRRIFRTVFSGAGAGDRAAFRYRRQVEE